MSSDIPNEFSPTQRLGEATVRIDIDEETYERAAATYRYLVEAGLDHDPFYTLVYNRCSIETVVTVDGEPKGPEDLAEWIDGECAGCEEGGDHA